MSTPELDSVVVADARMRRASRRLKIASWLCLIPAAWLLHQGAAPGYDGFVFDDPDMALAVTCLVAVLAPVMAAWGRVGRRRRIGLAVLGGLGAALTVALIGLDMEIVQKALKLGVRTDDWWLGCIIPSGNYQARVTEFGRLALILRLQAAVIGALMAQRRSSRWWQLALVGAGLGVAAAAGAPLVERAIEDHVYTHLQSMLPSVMYLVAFAAFEVCMLFGHLGRRATTRPPAKPEASTKAPPRARPRAGQRLSPDPAALAQGHRALVRARWWTLAAASVGVLGLVRFLVASLDLFALRVRHHEEASIAIACAVVSVISVIALMLLRAPGRRAAVAVAELDEVPAELKQPGLRALVEMLERARVGLEHGQDEVFESLYGDLELQFENLDLREREWAKHRGMTRARVRSLLDQGADHEGELDADLRRALHRELSSMLASLRGLEQVDPYRADLDTRSFIAQLGLDWIRADRAGLEAELRVSRRGVGKAASFTLAAVIALASMVSGWQYGGDVCMPGIDSCRVDFDNFADDVFWDVLIAGLLLFPWAIGAAYRRMASRSFAASRPWQESELVVPLASQGYEDTLSQIARPRDSALKLRTTLSVMLLTSVPLVSLYAAQRQHWLAYAIDDALILNSTLAAVVVLALVCVRPVQHGLRRLYAKLWLAWLCADRPLDWTHGPLLVELVRCRVELATAPLLTEAHLEAIAKRIAVAPLASEDADAILVHLERVRGRLHEAERRWLPELEQQLVACELMIAEGAGGLT